MLVVRWNGSCSGRERTNVLYNRPANPLLALAEVGLNLGGRYLGRAGKVDHLDALVAQEVELSGPVVAHHEDVGVVELAVGPLLLPAGLRDHEVHVAHGLEELLSLLPGEVAPLALLVPVELVCGERHDEVVAQLAGAAEQVDVAVMEQVVGAVGYDSAHGCTSGCNRLFNVTGFDDASGAERIDLARG